MEWPFRCSAWLARLKHAEGYCAATRGEKGRGWLMRWLPSLAHDTARSWFSVTKWESMTTRFRTGTAMIRDPPCGASPGTPPCPADCSSAAPNPGCRAREAGGGLGMFELSGACGPSVARQFSNPGTDRPALEPELDQRDPGTRPRRRRRIRAAARRSQHRTGHRMDCLSAGCQLEVSPLGRLATRGPACAKWTRRRDGWTPPVLPCRIFQAVPIAEMTRNPIPLVPNARRFKSGHCIRVPIASVDQAADTPAMLGLRPASVGTSALNTIWSSSRLIPPIPPTSGRPARSPAH